MPKPILCKSRTELNDHIENWQKEGLKIGLVPTMGALHHGHLSLVSAIKPYVDKVIVTIFVNPTQFGAGEDFDTYPRTLNADHEKLINTATDLIYAPAVNDIYPDGFSSFLSVSGPLTNTLEGAHRSGHFNGVATIVAKLINQCHADIAIFGEKDYQQLAVIQQFTKDMDMPVQIMGAPIIRENDGLAASSRNQYLNDNDRAIAGQLNIIMKQVINRIHTGHTIKDSLQHGIDACLKAGFDTVDYCTLVDKDSLIPLHHTPANGTARLLVTARIKTETKTVRLLDNMSV